MSEKAALNEPAKAANEIATKIESAVRSDDNQSYSNALAEVDKYRASHTQEETNQLVGSIAKKLEEDKLLPRVSLFEAKRNFDRIDVGGDGTLQVRELNAFKGQRDVNELQQKFVDHVVKNFDAVGDHKSDWTSNSSIAMTELDAGIKAAADREQRETALKNLFQRDAKGVSLYDKLKDDSGNIPPQAIGNLLDMDKQNPKVLGLTDQDRASLKFLNESKTINQQYNAFADDMKKEDLKKLCQDNGLAFDKLVPAETQKNKAALESFFHKNAGAESLYDRLKDSNGHIPDGAVKRLLDLDAKLPAAANLSDREREALKALSADGLTKDALEKKCTENGLDFSKLTAGDTQTEKKSPEVSESVQPPISDGNRSAVTNPAVQSEKHLKSGQGDHHDSAKLGELNASVRQGEHNASGRQAESQGNLAGDKNQRVAAQGEQRTSTTQVDQHGPRHEGQAGAGQLEQQSHAQQVERPTNAKQVDRNAAASQFEHIPVTPEQARAMESIEQAKLDERLKDALTVQRGESYPHCAERLLALAGNTDPTGAQIRKLARQLWIADHKREAYGLRVNQVLNLSDEIRNNKDVAKLFA